MKRRPKLGKYKMLKTTDICQLSGVKPVKLYREAAINEAVGFNIKDMLASVDSAPITATELESLFVERKLKPLDSDTRNKIVALNRDLYYTRLEEIVDADTKLSRKDYRMWLNRQIFEAMIKHGINRKMLTRDYKISQELYDTIATHNLWRTTDVGERKCEKFLLAVGVDIYEHPYKLLQLENDSN